MVMMMMVVGAIYDRLNACSCTLFLVNCIPLFAIVLSSEVPLHSFETSKKLDYIALVVDG
jgi:hypothetical protein